MENIFLYIRDNDYYAINSLDLHQYATKKNYLKQTPLIYACEINACESIIKLLIKYSKDDINNVDIFGKTALHYAEYHFNINIMELLKKYYY